MTYLIADIGGTKTTCGITTACGQVTSTKSFSNSNYENPSQLLRDYLQKADINGSPQQAILAVAAPIRGDRVDMVNIDWHFSAGALKDDLSIRELTLLNDFEALAYSLPELQAEDLIKIGSGEPEVDYPKAVLGPGTGLGVAGLIPVGNSWRAVGGEGGHVSLAPTDEYEAQIILRVQKQFGHCSAERLISGPGLAILHSLMHGGETLSAEEIGERAANDDPQARASLDRLFRFLGTVASNLALTFGAFGGIYIGGGIVPRHAEQFAASDFRDRFESKGRYDNYLRSIPTYLIVADNPTLTGLAVFASNAS